MSSSGAKIHGSKSVQVKGVMLLWQPNPGKHRPAKPCGRADLNNYPAGMGNCYAGFAWMEENGAFQADDLDTAMWRTEKRGK